MALYTQGGLDVGGRMPATKAYLIYTDIAARPVAGMWLEDRRGWSLITTRTPGHPRPLPGTEADAKELAEAYITMEY